MQNDVVANRAAPKWTRREQIRRILWSLATPLFRLSPRPLWGWRCLLLHLFGARVGRQVHVYPTVRTTIPWNLILEDNCAVGDQAILYALRPIRIGARATVSQGANLCAGTHDIKDASRPHLKPPISIGNDAWFCADALIGEAAATRASVGTGCLECLRCGRWIYHGPEALAAALWELMSMSDHARQQMSSRGGDWMARDFSWDRMAQLSVGAYAWALGQRDPPDCVQAA